MKFDEDILMEAARVSVKDQQLITDKANLIRITDCIRKHGFYPDKIAREVGISKKEIIRLVTQALEAWLNRTYEEAK